MKGIFYSAIVMMLLAPIVMYIILYLGSTETQLEEIHTKIKSDRIVGYATSVEQDLPRALDITSKIAIGTAISYIDMNGLPLDNADERILEVMENGTIYGSEFELFESDSIEDWINSIETKGHLYGFNTNITVVSLEIKPYDSFNVLLLAVISVNITDNREMQIYKIYNEGIVVSIEGFEDPLYSLETNGLLKRKFAKSELIDDVVELDVSVADELYMNSTNGPSFFDRLEGRLSLSNKYKDMTPLQIGLETIVYLPDLSAAGFSIKPTQSNIDYLYFNSSSYTGYPVNNSAYSWLKLDETHADIYNVQLIK